MQLEGLRELANKTYHRVTTTRTEITQFRWEMSDRQTALLAELAAMEQVRFDSIEESRTFRDKLEKRVLALRSADQPAAPDWYDRPMKDKLKIT